MMIQLYPTEIRTPKITKPDKVGKLGDKIPETVQFEWVIEIVYMRRK